MGRMRDGYETPLFQCVNAEVVDLFGIDDVVLYKPLPKDNVDFRDPLWDEPIDTIRYRAYKIKAMFLDYQDEFQVNAEGSSQDRTNLIHVAIGHLVSAHVPKDELNDYIGEGDLIEIHYKGDRIVYNIIQANRVGYINNSDQYTGVDLNVTRSTVYVGERYLIPIVH